MNAIGLWTAACYCIAALAGQVAHAAPSDAGELIDCPSSFKSEDVSMRNAPAGWTPFVVGDLRLTGIGIMFGPPAEEADAVPYSTVDVKDGHTSTWHFSAEDHDPKWVKCFYGQGWNVTLSKKLDDSTTECVAKYKNTKLPGRPPVEMRCTRRAKFDK